MEKHQISTIEKSIEGLPIQEAIAALCDSFAGRVVFSTSFGQEDQVLSHLIFSHKLPVRVFTLDTGRLFEETYEVFAKTIDRYQTKIDVLPSPI
ncbi:MAG: phosphoadenosine phosphosulfate reductase family protein [Saprospiraceae bacterium]